MTIIFIVFILIGFAILITASQNSTGGYYEHRSYDTTNDKDIPSKTEEQECDEYYEWKINRK